MRNPKSEFLNSKQALNSNVLNPKLFATLLFSLSDLFSISCLSLLISATGVSYE